MGTFIGFCRDASTYSFPRSVVDNLRLADGAVFPMPITLDVSREDIERLNIVPGARIALRDPRDDQPLAIITGESVSKLGATIAPC